MQFTENEDRVKSLSCNQSFLSSTQDSTESIATPHEADFEDEQIRALLASPRYLLQREASAERSHFYHSERESLMSSSSQDPKPVGTGKPLAVFSSQKSLNFRHNFRERESNLFWRVMNRFSDSLTWQMLRNLFLVEIEITCLLK